MARCILILLFSLLFHIGVQGEAIDGVRNYHIDKDFLYSSGCIYYEGENYGKAYDCLSSFFSDESWRSSSTSVAKGLRYLSSCYRFGRGCEVNSEKADYWMEQAMQWGDENALKLLFDEDWNTLSDEERRKKLDFCVENTEVWPLEMKYPLLSYKKGNRDSVQVLECYISYSGLNGKETSNIEKRMVDILLSMKTLNAEDMYVLSYCYKEGLGSLQKNDNESMGYLLKAADLGNEDAMYQLALANFKYEVEEKADSVFIKYASKVLGREHIRLLVGYYHYKYGEHFKKLGNRRNQESYFNDALRIWKSLADGGEHEVLVNNYGMLLYRLYSIEKCVPYLENAYQMSEQSAVDYGYGKLERVNDDLCSILADYYFRKSLDHGIAVKKEPMEKAIYYYEQMFAPLDVSEKLRLAECYCQTDKYEQAKSILNGIGPTLSRYEFCPFHRAEAMIYAKEGKYEVALGIMLDVFEACYYSGVSLQLFQWYSWGKFGYEYDINTERDKWNKEYIAFTKNLYKKKTKGYILKGLEILYK